jgi:triosephosphate isomerase
MRRYLVAGNWKLNLGPRAGRALAREVRDGLARLEHFAGAEPGCDVLVCPPFVTIPAVREVATGDPLWLGAQTCADHESGAFTGEVAATMLAEAGCSHVIVGHSERRQYQNEDDEQFVRKIDRAHAAGLTAIFCFGEQLAERQQGRAEAVVRDQITGVLPRLTGATAANTVLAYEPVWAIGTGETATPEIAQAMHAHARAVVAESCEAELAARIRILYGGSCKPTNAGELFALPDVDGGLIGGASLAADSFVGIVAAATAPR